MGIADQIKETQASRRAAAEQEYARAIVAGDRAAVERLMEELGLSVDDVRSDEAALAAIRSAEQSCVAQADLDAATAEVVRTSEIEERLQREFEAASTAAAQARGRRSVLTYRHSDAINRAATLKLSHRRLLLSASELTPPAPKAPPATKGKK